MIISIGCDIVDKLITGKLKWAQKASVRARIFSASELAEFEKTNDIRYLNGRFACKESVLKALGIGMIDGIDLTEIEILSGKAGEPIIKLSGYVKRIAKKKGITKWHLSISHSPRYTLSVAVAEG